MVAPPCYPFEITPLNDLYRCKLVRSIIVIISYLFALILSIISSNIYTRLAVCNCLSITLRSGDLPALLMAIFMFQDEIESFKCSCDQGYEGYACDQLVDHCSDFPCDNGGNCTSGLVSYTCSCPTGKTQ